MRINQRMTTLSDIRSRWPNIRDYYMIGMIVIIVNIFNVIPFVSALSSSTKLSQQQQQQQVTQLLEQNRETVIKLKNVCQQTVGDVEYNQQPYCNDVFYLRYCISDDKDDIYNKFKSTLEWRMSEQGQIVCNAARTGLEQQQQQGTTTNNNENTWKNQPILTNAPHSNVIGKYISPFNAITTTSNQNDLVYCIRAGNINDNELMSNVSVEQMVLFFLYVKEINSIVSNIRSIQYNKLIKIITCNDLSNVKIIGSNSNFRTALSTSSQIANINYASSYNGPTLLCNLPILLSALVKLFTPLFPKSVNERLKFVQGPLKTVSDLQYIGRSYPDRNEYETFCQQLDTVLYT